jgi:5'-3' exonuclease
VKPPPWQNDPSALVLVDWSWILNRAMHGDQGIDGMCALVVGLLCKILAYEPAHLALCLDSPGETWRHRLRHPTNEEWRYKAGRPPKPPEFAAIARRCTEIAELHGIPCLWADAYEADDVIATAVRQARAAGYRVWIATADKDLHHLVDSDERSGVTVGIWTPWERDTWIWRGPSDVREAFGVEPAQIADWLAISGDASDGVPGVGHGLGPTRAAAILREHGTLAAALAAPVWSSTKAAEIEREIAEMGKRWKKALGAGESLAPLATALERDRAGLMSLKRVAGWHLTLKAHAEVALWCRELTALDCDAPVDVPFEQLPLGGYDVEGLRAAYTKLGFTRLAERVPHRAKRMPWRMPWVAPDEAQGARSDEVYDRDQRPGRADRRDRGGGNEGRGEDRASRGRAGGDRGEASGQGGGDLRDMVRVGGVLPDRGGHRGEDGDGARGGKVAPTPTEIAVTEERLARSLLERTWSVTGLRFAIEDLTSRNRYTHLDPAVREEVLAKLRERLAKKGGAAA